MTSRSPIFHLLLKKALFDLTEQNKRYPTAEELIARIKIMEYMEKKEKRNGKIRTYK